jgi:hypothetical protein
MKQPHMPTANINTKMDLYPTKNDAINERIKTKEPRADVGIKSCAVVAEFRVTLLYKKIMIGDVDAHKRHKVRFKVRPSAACRRGA